MKTIQLKGGQAWADTRYSGQPLLGTEITIFVDDIAGWWEHSWCDRPYTFIRMKHYTTLGMVEYNSLESKADFERRLAEVMEGKEEENQPYTLGYSRTCSCYRCQEYYKEMEDKFGAKIRPTDLLAQYAIAAHWYIHASDEELLNFGETRQAALNRINTVESDLYNFVGFRFVDPGGITWGVHVPKE